MLFSYAEAVEEDAVAKPLNITGIDCPVELRRSPRARRISLKVSHTRRAAILTMPRFIQLKDAGDFLARHFDWLKRQTERMPKPVMFQDGAAIPLRGIIHRLEFVGPERKRGVVWQVPGNGMAVWRGQWDPAREHAMGTGLPMSLLPRLCVAGEYAHAPRRLEDWLKAQARKDLTERANAHAANLGVVPRRISVRDQSTRWGSCSCSGALSFSWRLIFAPAFVLDYVAAHEVAHLREMNHGPRFWRLVKETMPQMREARHWLRVYGAELHRFTA